MTDPLTFEAQVARRRARRSLQDEMGSDWTEGRQLAHDEAQALVRRQHSMSRRVTLAHSHLPHDGGKVE
jgi:hypothetical protein